MIPIVNCPWLNYVHISLDGQTAAMSSVWTTRPYEEEEEVTWSVR